MIIYVITNLINGKKYIGQTTRTLKRRWYGHCKKADKNNNLFHNAIAKYGKNNFKVETIKHASNVDELNKLEKHYIENFKTLHPNGYNLKTGGNQCCVYSDVSKKKMRDAKLGTVVTKNTRKKMSKAHKDLWKNNDILRNKQSIKSKKMWQDSEYRNKISKIRKQYWSNPVNRKNASDNAKKQVTNEYRKKISTAVKESHKRSDVKEKLKQQSIKQKRKIINNIGEKFDSIKAAAKEYSIPESSIVKNLKGKYKSAGGKQWFYIF